MNRFIIAGVSVFFASVTGLSFAATPTPVVPKSKVASAGTPLHQVNERLRTDMMQIQKDLKAGKLTKAQSASAKAQVIAIRKQELADMKANGNKTLTDSQVSTLNASLDQLQSSL